eukprot:793807-Amphidinium_carterae.2
MRGDSDEQPKDEPPVRVPAAVDMDLTPEVPTSQEKEGQQVTKRRTSTFSSLLGAVSDPRRHVRYVFPSFL